jgi:hypothetical protein
LFSDRAGADGQDEESCLESIFGVVLIVQDPLTDTQDHWSVPLHKSSEGSFTALIEELFEQPGIALSLLPRHQELKDRID